MEQSKRTSKSSYFVDTKLCGRIRKYLEEKNMKIIPLDTLVDDLHSRYSEYKRKKKFAFRGSVQRAYDVIKGEQSDDYDKYGEEFLRKQKGIVHKCGDVSPEFSDENEEYVSYSDTNTMNSFMANMYKKNKKRTAHSAPVSASSSPKRPDLDTSCQVPDLGKNLFVIDKTGSGSKKTPHEPDLACRSSTPKSKATMNSTGDKNMVPDLPMVIENNESGSILEKTSSSNVEVSHKDKEMDSLPVKDSASVKSASGAKRKKKALDRDSNKKLPDAQMSTVTFADVGGSDKTLKEVCKLLVHMKHPEVYQQLGITPPRGFLLHGPPGCGKTLLAHAIAGELTLPLIKLAATEVVSGVSGESEEKLRDVFEKAISSAPCILFIDEIDSITQKRENASKDMERRIVAQLLACMDDLNSKPSIQVLVIGATNRADSIDPALRRAGRFDREISLGIPGEDARQRILEVLCRGLRLTPDFDFKSLAHNTPGFVGADLMSLAREAAMVAVNRVFEDVQGETVGKTVSNMHSEMNVDSFTNTYSEQTESSKLNGLIVSKSQSALTEDLISKSDMDIDPQTADSLSCVKLGNEVKAYTENGASPSDSVQLKNLRKVPERQKDDYNSVLLWLKEHPPLSPEQLTALFITMEDFQTALKLVQPSAKREGFATIPDVTWEDIGALKDIRAPVRHPEQFRALGLTSPPGILLAGPPGCGKTLLAKAVANESGINFISVKGPELLNMYVGESERAVRQVFQRARNSAPCVIFFDEIDALCPRRSGSGEGGSSVRVVNQLLTEMDGLEERKHVFIMGATNRPDIIDPAILRPGRLDKQLYVGLPGPEDRLDILTTITKNGTKPRLLEDVILEDISSDSRCNCFTGADLAALVREASVTALREFITCNKPQDPVCVSKRHFDLAFTKVKPSVSQKDLEVYKKMRNNLAIS